MCTTLIGFSLAGAVIYLHIHVHVCIQITKYRYPPCAGTSLRQYSSTCSMACVDICGCSWVMMCNFEDLGFPH